MSSPKAGRHDVDAWLSEPVEPELHLKTVLFAKVMLALMLGRPAATDLDAQRGAHLRRMRELTELKRAGASSTRCSQTTTCSTSKPTCAGTERLTAGRLSALAETVRS